MMVCHYLPCEDLNLFRRKMRNCLLLSALKGQAVGFGGFVLAIIGVAIVAIAIDQNPPGEVNASRLVTRTCETRLTACICSHLAITQFRVSVLCDFRIFAKCIDQRFHPRQAKERFDSRNSWSTSKRGPLEMKSDRTGWMGFECDVFSSPLRGAL